jgi:serine/threonine protein kinase/Tfp pilus assembly protein PilF
VATKCPKCQTENPDTSQFCADCGTRIRGHVPDSPESGTCPQNSKDVRSEATATLQTPVNELTTGSTFAGRYQIIEELGKGGMGWVYKAYDTEIKEKIGLKLLRPEIGLDEEMIERFRNELKLARKISQRNVCRMHDLNKELGAYYITMEYVAGEDLKRLIRKIGQMSAGKTISIAKQVCEGLAEAHSLGIVHRDLKPQNIMVDEAGNAKIMDFGIARSLAAKGLTGAGMMIGTPEYMSPEQVEGKDVDQRSDIYSLGIILYEMVTGRVPFEGDTPFTIAVKHKSEIPKDPKELNVQIPGELSRLILRCLEKDKENRFQNIKDLHADLVKVEQALPTSERFVFGKRSLTSREITVKFNLKKVFFRTLVILALVIAAAIIIWRSVPKKGTSFSQTDTLSIAVLPFVDDSPEKGHEYLCEGIPNTLINALNTVQNLRVPARTSAFSFAGKGLDIQGIGQKLNVENVLEGSVQVFGNNLRVTASLVKVNDGYQIWNATYDRRLEDVFAIQDEIAQAIVTALKVRVLGDREEPLVKRGTQNLEAYKFYLEGLYYWNKRTGKDLNKAIELFGQAIDQDPKYALAYVGLADSYSLVSMYGGPPPQEVFPQAKAAATKALEINENLAEAHNSLAYVYQRYDWNWKAAEAEFKRSLELNPNYATGHFWYSELLVSLGRFEEGIREMKQALELDPVSLVINENLGWVYLMAGQKDLALVQLRKTLEMDQNFAATHLMLGFAHLQKGNMKEATEEMKKARELSAEAPTVVISFALVCAAAGRLEEADAILEELTARSQKQHASPFRMAEVYAVMGDLDKAFELLNKAYEEKDEWMTTIKISPNLAPFHSDPRYQALLKKMGLD